MKQLAKYAFFFLAGWCSIGTLAAQDVKTDADIDLPEGMVLPMDSLLSEWITQTHVTTNTDCQSLDVNPVFPDSVYIERLSRIPAIMEMPYNDIVRRYIDAYTVRMRDKVSLMLAASNFYIPIFEQALDAYDLPLELRYLPIIESALNPTAVSRARAVGLWQFMLATGKIYGLEVNTLVDERRDPIKSSYAAARHLKSLYAIYQDWTLVIAAYNCGAGNVNKAVRRAGGKTDYWAIYNYLPRETRGYVPAFIAANYVMNYYCEHGICPMNVSLPADTDTIHVNQRVHFQQIAAYCNISIEQLRSLNPEFKQDIVPGNVHTYALRLPLNSLASFIDKQDSIYVYRADQLFKNRRTVAAASTPARTQAKAGTGERIRYRIRSGDTLSGIAERHGVSIANLRSWNGITGSRITAGKYLDIYK
ncbi:MAG: transglycosylase SLT domain-containing protein [Prevotellaceae bacterium]|jgi:membrane-bound lytic murein transglycosylase D|nr:transglycosylase SLT domain-containing protein [Prevotellaceae bacterium]